jgi:hypothetical protein
MNYGKEIYIYWLDCLDVASLDEFVTKKIEILIFECIYNMFNQFMSIEDSIGNKVCIHMCNLLWNIFINLSYYVKKLRVQKQYVTIFNYIENLTHCNIMCTNYQTY